MMLVFCLISKSSLFSVEKQKNLAN